MTAPFDILWALLAMFAGVLFALLSVHGWRPLGAIGSRGARRGGLCRTFRKLEFAETEPGMLVREPVDAPAAKSTPLLVNHQDTP